jgi:type I restriction enzyme S subunit
MNPERLLQNFDRLIDTPDAVPRLRRFILDLAVRGKLVEQNLEDEPAAELLKRIEAEKRRHFGGSDKKTQSLDLDKDQIPFAIPHNWQWTQLAQIGVINPRNDAEDSTDASFVPMPLIFAEYGRAHQHEVRSWSEIKKGFTHFAEGDVGLAKITPCFENGKSTVFRNLTGRLGAGTTELHIVRPILVLPDYILLYLKTLFFIETGIPKMTGTAGQKRVPKDYFSFSPFPLPPLAEQHRIVAKVDELMKLCNELEAAQTKRERRRERLVAATLHGLNNGDSESATSERFPFEESARFYFNHLPRLTTRPEHIQQLRQIILSLAVRGKLVPQNSADEPPSSLIAQIDAERKLRAKAGESINKQISADSNNGPFSIPKSWGWSKLGFLTNVVMGQSPSGDTYNVRGDGMPLINGPVEFSEGPFGITVLNQYTSAPIKLCKKGDLLLCVRGSTTGRTNIAGFDACIGRGVATLQALYEDDFIGLFVCSWRDQIIAMGRGIAFPSISRRQIEDLPTPLPPLVEQHRIVSKVDELMALCDEMEAQITTTATTYRQLLEATLAETLSGQLDYLNVDVAS